MKQKIEILKGQCEQGCLRVSLYFRYTLVFLCLLLQVISPRAIADWWAFAWGGPFEDNPRGRTPMENCWLTVYTLETFYIELGHPRSFDNIHLSNNTPDNPNQLTCNYEATRTTDGRTWPVEIDLFYSVGPEGTCPPNTIEDPVAKICLPIYDECKLDNPVGVAGNKYQQEVDFKAGNGILEFTRYFSGLDARSRYSAFENKWRHTYERQFLVTEYDQFHYITLYTPEGRLYLFNSDGNGGWTGHPQQKAILESITDAQGEVTGYRFTDRDDQIEEYDAAGRLLSIVNRDGTGVTLSYDYRFRLETVTDSYSVSLQLAYDGKSKVSQLTIPGGDVYRYEYDAIGRQSKVYYPDDTPQDPNDNPFKQYHYEDAVYPDLLTGISNEAGVRIASWGYDANGLAISSTHPGGADQGTLVFNTNGTTTHTNALGKQTTFHYDVYGTERKVTQVEGHPTPSCAAANRAKGYDSNGFLISKTDWSGNLTTYIRDVQGLETSRTEVSGTPQARTITTQWHANFRLPTKITEPDRVIDFTYDTDGNLLQRKETPNTTP